MIKYSITSSPIDVAFIENSYQSPVTLSGDIDSTLLAKYGVNALREINRKTLGSYSLLGLFEPDGIFGEEPFEGEDNPDFTPEVNNILRSVRFEVRIAVAMIAEQWFLNKYNNEELKNSKSFNTGGASYSTTEDVYRNSVETLNKAVRDQINNCGIQSLAAQVNAVGAQAVASGFPFVTITEWREDRDRQDTDRDLKVYIATLADKEGATTIGYESPQEVEYSVAEALDIVWGSIIAPQSFRTLQELTNVGLKDENGDDFILTIGDLYVDSAVDALLDIERARTLIVENKTQGLGEDGDIISSMLKPTGIWNGIADLEITNQDEVQTELNKYTSLIAFDNGQAIQNSSISGNTTNIQDLQEAITKIGNILMVRKTSLQILTGTDDAITLWNTPTKDTYAGFNITTGEYTLNTEEIIAREYEVQCPITITAGGGVDLEIEVSLFLNGIEVPFTRQPFVLEPSTTDTIDYILESVDIGAVLNDILELRIIANAGSGQIDNTGNLSIEITGGTTLSAVFSTTEKVSDTGITRSGSEPFDVFLTTQGFVQDITRGFNSDNQTETSGLGKYGFSSTGATTIYANNGAEAMSYNVASNDNKGKRLVNVSPGTQVGDATTWDQSNLKVDNTRLDSFNNTGQTLEIDQSSQDITIGNNTTRINTTETLLTELLKLGNILVVTDTSTKTLTGTESIVDYLIEQIDSFGGYDGTDTYTIPASLDATLLTISGTFKFQNITGSSIDVMLYRNGLLDTTTNFDLDTLDKVWMINDVLANTGDTLQIRVRETVAGTQTVAYNDRSWTIGSGASVGEVPTTTNLISTLNSTEYSDATGLNTVIDTQKVSIDLLNADNFIPGEIRIVNVGALDGNINYVSLGLLQDGQSIIGGSTTNGISEAFAALPVHRHLNGMPSDELGANTFYGGQNAGLGNRNRKTGSAGNSDSVWTQSVSAGTPTSANGVSNIQNKAFGLGIGTKEIYERI